jgi:hypothetical protein
MKLEVQKLKYDFAFRSVWLSDLISDIEEDA